jgi:F420-dependent oxidoreductase-like protein
MDHFFQIQGLGPATDPMLESYTTLSYLAGFTQRARLGALVTAAIYRPPAVLVKMISTLDVVSGGRAYFGIGAGWNEQEARGLGLYFPSWSERFESLEETLQIALQMWSGDQSAYQGKHYTLAEPINSPQPLSQPHPPILIGGAGEKKTLRMVAKYGDACNLMAHLSPDELRHKLDVLKRHCDEVGRPYEEIEKTVLGGVDLAPGKMTAKDMIDQCKRLALLGIQQFIINMPNTHEIWPVETIAREVIPEVKDF